ncbi:universal stress protein [Arachidicoccus sp.]|jgi:nucleotide-binding universal stress UspA family protein|uniref:universal stress protein n=1 Tax=Arachidicoccus sp. TaxID=1872624 RepID=UPI003D19B135
MKTIIVPINFSEVSINAAYYAADMAVETNSAIILMHVFTLPLGISETPQPFDRYETEAVEKSMKQLKDQLEFYVRDRIPIISYITTGNFLEAMQALLKTTDPFAVIMGSKEINETAAFFVGSYIFSVAHNVDCTLIVVPPKITYNAIKNVGLACDLKSMPAYLPLSNIEDLLEKFKASLQVLYISKPGEDNEACVNSGTKFMKDSLARFSPEISIGKFPEVSVGITELIGTHHIDLLMVIPKKHEFPQNIFHKSITNEIIHNSGIPIMVLHK